MPIPVASALSEMVVASATITDRQMLNLHASSGAKVRPANATAEGSEVDFVAGAAGASSALIPCLLPGQLLPGFSGLTPGSRYYLDTTPGAITLTPPSTAGNVVQCVGKALSATELWFAPEPPITVA